MFPTLPGSRLLIAALLGLGSRAVLAQTLAPAAPKATYATPVPPAVRQLYAAADPVPALLYSGPEYVDYAMRYGARVGHQFFLVPEPQPGSVVYNQQPFDNLLLRYDVVLGQLVLNQPTSPLTLRLVNEKLARFTVDGHRFERLQADSTAGLLTTGFYEVLADGPVRLLVRRAKRLQERIENRMVKAEFIPTDRLYAYKQGRYYALNSKSAVLQLLADREPEVRAYQRQHKLKLRRKLFENVTWALITYYNQLPPR